ncbi:MAG: transposase [Deltaproteobacteria bacterium]|jgi:REP element-mobilizing transposase RayT|nr:transposase [Deltaproteobacteria bacterium]
MPKPRYRQVSIEDTPYYHCISRCVRRAFLCGKDSLTGFDFNHRRQWITDRIRLISSVFAVDLCAYAIMSNHYHVVVRINNEQVNNWSDEEVARRWMQIFTGPRLMHQYLGNANLTSTEHKWVAELFTTWRARLCDLSWYMRCINEPIARMANAEDHCTGSFWEGRFKSQALLDERALLACMAYVDLNPIRAAMATTPEESDYTSIQERIKYPDSSTLGVLDEDSSNSIPINLKDYLDLVEWGGREVKHNKLGYIPPKAPPILVRLKMDAAPVLDYLAKDNLPGLGPLGPVSRLRSFAQSIGRKFVKGHVYGGRLCPERH